MLHTIATVCLISSNDLLPQLLRVQLRGVCRALKVVRGPCSGHCRCLELLQQGRHMLLHRLPQNSCFTCTTGIAA